MEQIAKPIINPIGWFTKLLISLGKLMFVLIVIAETPNGSKRKVAKKIIINICCLIFISLFVSY